ncbi:MAG: hypothetical protein LBH70_01135, partial [Spirochaetaceae bacterium]|nr:hypothetical protein [Spirochaetaceae bacterium]
FPGATRSRGTSSAVSKDGSALAVIASPLGRSQSSAETSCLDCFGAMRLAMTRGAAKEVLSALGVT